MVSVQNRSSVQINPVMDDAFRVSTRFRIIVCVLESYGDSRSTVMYLVCLHTDHDIFSSRKTSMSYDRFLHYEVFKVPPRSFLSDSLIIILLRTRFVNTYSHFFETFQIVFPVNILLSAFGRNSIIIAVYSFFVNGFLGIFLF